MRAIIVAFAFALTACGGATDTKPTRYNFAVVDGLNQSSTAGTVALAKPIVSQLTRDPEGKFATRVFDFLAPAVAYAQGIVLKGEPVAGQIVCGEESGLGEPKVVPLCAYTLEDGKAANSVEGGTKAGTYTMRFTAQNVGTAPIKDSTNVTVLPGPAVDATHLQIDPGWATPRPVKVGETVTVLPVVDARDQYGNAIPDYAKTATTGIAIRRGDEPGEPTPDVQGTLSYTVDKQYAVTADGTTCEHLPCRIYLYFWVGIFRGSASLDVSP